MDLPLAAWLCTQRSVPPVSLLTLTLVTHAYLVPAIRRVPPWLPGSQTAVQDGQDVAQHDVTPPMLQSRRSSRRGLGGHSPGKGVVSCPRPPVWAMTCTTSGRTTTLSDAPTDTAAAHYTPAADQKAFRGARCALRPAPVKIFAAPINSATNCVRGV